MVARTEEGRVVHYHPTRSRSSRSVEVTLSESSDNEIAQLIDRLTEIFTNFNQYYADDILTVIYECSKFKEYSKMIDVLKLMEDEEFIQAVYENFCNLSKALGENCKRILSYHSVCFGDLMLQLLRHQDIDNKKNTLKLFFRNLLNSVSGKEFVEQPTGKKHQKLPTEENWNRPGPSGLQSSQTSATVENDVEHNNNTNEEENIRPNKIIIGNISNNRGLVIDRRISNIRSIDRISDLGRANNAEGDRNSSFVTISPRVNIYFESSGTQRQIFVRMADEPRDRRNENNIVLQALPRDIPTNIKELSLRGYLVTDKTLVALKEMDLDLLDVTNTKVTITGVQQFMMSNPQCRLIHESACVCRPRLHF